MAGRYIVIWIILVLYMCVALSLDASGEEEGSEEEVDVTEDGQIDIPAFLPDELNCPVPGVTWLTVKNIPWYTDYRAFLTIPPEVELTKSNIPQAGLGIRATTFIPSYTWLGEYEGETMVEEHLMTEYSFHVPRNDNIQFFVDAYNERTSNWLRWINCPRNYQEENVRWLYCAGKVYFITMKDIYPSQELFMYYGHEYARYLGITYKLHETEGY